MKNLTAYAQIRVEYEGDVAIVSMSRPERRNALSLEMMRELDAALAAIAGDGSARAVILRGEGPAFCAGHDLRELLDRDVGS
jgi:enoyl-CoA hydratase/carnithine racemase